MLGAAIVFAARGFFQGLWSDKLTLTLTKRAGGIVFDQKNYTIQREITPFRYWAVLVIYAVILVWSTVNFIGNLLVL